ncbi:hemolysin family protein [candidate division KSB1 bacterium]
MRTIWVAMFIAALFLLFVYFSYAHFLLAAYSRTRWEKLAEDHRRTGGLVRFILHHRRRLHLATLLGRYLLLVGFSYVTISALVPLLAGWGIAGGAATVLALTAIVLVFMASREIILNQVIKCQCRIIYGVIASFRPLYYLFSPILVLILKLGDLILRLMRLGDHELFLTQGEVSLEAEIHDHDEKEEADERTLIQGVVDFGDRIVREVMLPRINMVCANIDLTADEVVDLIRREGHSRLPVYKDRLDNIVGVLYAKDLLIRDRDTADKPIAALARPAYFVPESKRISELLREFQKERIHMAVVVDEYGGCAGLVTLEDLIEEIVGEIQDEYDAEEPLFEMVDDRTVILHPKISIDELNERFNLLLPSEGFETLGGFILDRMGRVPKRGEETDYEGLKIKIEKASRQNIILVRLSLPEDVAARGE